MILRVVTALLGAALAGSATAQEVPLQLQPGEVLLQVEAEGEHQSRPDMMWISAGVVTTGRTAAEAMRANGELAARLIERVRQLGVEARDVQTSRLSLRPRLDGDRDVERTGRPPNIVGYVAQNRLSLTLRDLNRAADIIPALLEAGANEVEGPRFGFNEARPAEAAAERAAIAAARVQAQNYAGALNMRLGRVVRVRDRESFTVGEETITVTGSRMRAPVLEPGEITTRARVWIDFALTPG